VSYIWSDDSTTDAIEVGEPGSYSLTVTNEHSCTAENSIAIDNFEELVYSFISEDYYNDFDGMATVEIISGSEPIEIFWSNESTNFTVTSLSPGTYFFTLTDDNGCEFSDSVVIQDMSDINTEQVVDQFSLFPNPVSEILYISSENSNIIQIGVFDTQGRLIEKSVFDQNEISMDVSELSTGIYFFELDDGEQKRIFRIIKE
jgi:hypothetical protein